MRQKIKINVIKKPDRDYANCGATYGGSNQLEVILSESNTPQTTAKPKVSVTVPQRDYKDCGASYGGSSNTNETVKPGFPKVTLPPQIT